jgi:hypothetical protein
VDFTNQLARHVQEEIDVRAGRVDDLTTAPCRVSEIEAADVDEGSLMAIVDQLEAAMEIDEEHLRIFDRRQAP